MRGELQNEARRNTREMRGSFITFLRTTLQMRRQGRWVAETGITFPFRTRFKQRFKQLYIFHGASETDVCREHVSIKAAHGPGIFYFTWQLARPRRTAPHRIYIKESVSLDCQSCWLKLRIDSYVDARAQSKSFIKELLIKMIFIKININNSEIYSSAVNRRFLWRVLGAARMNFVIVFIWNLGFDIMRIGGNGEPRIGERELTGIEKDKGTKEKRENTCVIPVDAYVCRSPAASRDLAGVHENWAAHVVCRAQVGPRWVWDDATESAESLACQINPDDTKVQDALDLANLGCAFNHLRIYSM